MEKNTEAHSDSNSQFPDVVTVYLPPEIQIENVESVAEEWLQLSLTPKQLFVMNAEKTERITTPGMQLIIALEKHVQAAGGILHITQAHENFTHAFKEMGLANNLQFLLTPPDQRFTQLQ